MVYSVNDLGVDNQSKTGQEPTTTGFGQKYKIALFPAIHEQGKYHRFALFCQQNNQKPTTRGSQRGLQQFNINVLHGFTANCDFCCQKQSYY